jgi:hypothetical protein
VPFEREHVADADHLVVRRDAEGEGRGRIGPVAPEREGAHLGVGTLAAAADDVEEVEHQPPAVVGGHERSLALVAHERAFGHEAVDRLADRADGHAVGGGERRL